jgi:flavin reductase (DIM6/NTAB) family NADH-FMN oxidoreductase RutF
MALAGARETLRALWSPLLAVTTRQGDRTNGQIAIAGLSASLLPEAPRVLLELWKANLTHDMVLASGVFAAHLLPTTPDSALDRSLALVRTLGMRSGRDEDKMAQLAVRSGATGCPVLADALTYLEARVVATMDGNEMTVFLADVVAGERLKDGEPLTLQMLRERVPPEWMVEWQQNQERQLAAARRWRGLPI